MKYFAIRNDYLESERFISASNDQLATWVWLHALCSKQMNGGTIEGASSLPERFWRRHGIDADILNQPSPLWEWEGERLSLEFYDIDGQRLYEKKVAGGKSGGRGRPNRTPNRTPKRTPDREEKRRDKKREEESTSSDDEGGGLFSEESVKTSKTEPFDHWNSIEALPKIRSLTEKRRKLLATRMRDPFFRDHWKDAADMIPGIPFLNGDNDRGWKADIDWFLQPDSVAKIIEGKYTPAVKPSVPAPKPITFID